MQKLKLHRFSKRTRMNTLAAELYTITIKHQTRISKELAIERLFN